MWIRGNVPRMAQTFIPIAGVEATGGSLSLRSGWSRASSRTARASQSNPLLIKEAKINKNFKGSKTNKKGGYEMVGAKRGSRIILGCVLNA